MEKQAMQQRIKDLRQHSDAYRIPLKEVSRRAGIKYTRLTYIMKSGLASVLEMDALEESMLKTIEEQRESLKRAAAKMNSQKAAHS